MTHTDRTPTLDAQPSLIDMSYEHPDTLEKTRKNTKQSKKIHENPGKHTKHQTTLKTTKTRETIWDVRCVFSPAKSVAQLQKLQATLAELPAQGLQDQQIY